MRRNIVPYDARLKALARDLRKNATPAEVMLWRHLKGKQVMGFDFHRQSPIDDYIVDFYCPELRLAIEIDGDSHGLKCEQDQLRQRRLESLGVRVQRFSERDVRGNTEGVLATIEEWVAQHTSCPPL